MTIHDVQPIAMPPTFCDQKVGGMAIGCTSRSSRRPVPRVYLSVYSRCCIRICSAMVGVPHRPRLPSLPTHPAGCAELRGQVPRRQAVGPISLRASGLPGGCSWGKGLDPHHSPEPLSSEGGATQNVIRAFTRKPGPESGRECLMCAKISG